MELCQAMNARHSRQHEWQPQVVTKPLGVSVEATENLAGQILAEGEAQVRREHPLLVENYIVHGSGMISVEEGQQTHLEIDGMMPMDLE